MYPKVKVRQDPYREVGGDVRDLGLKAFISLYLDDSPPPPVVDRKDVFKPSVVKQPKCYVPPAPTPRVLITDDFGDCSLTPDSSGSPRAEKDDSIDDNKINIRASPIPRPRAVISSPDNDELIGNRNRTKDGGRRSALKNGAVLQNRHAQCKVKFAADVITQDTRKSKEPGSKDKTDPVGKNKVAQKGNIKSENVHRNWRF